MRFVILLRLAVVAAFVLLGITVAAPAASAYPCCEISTAEISATTLQAGGQVTVTVKNTTPGPLTMQILSAPVTIGSGTVGADAAGSVTGAVPPGYSGAHTIHVVGAGGEVFDFAVRVVPPARGCCSGPTQDPDDGGFLASTGAQVALASGVGLAVLLGGVLIMLVARPRRLGSPRA